MPERDDTTWQRALAQHAAVRRSQQLIDVGDAMLNRGLRSVPLRGVDQEHNPTASDLDRTAISTLEELISLFAGHVSDQIVGSIVRELRCLPAELSGADSGLRNVWERICVQVQGTYSLYWDAYTDTLDQLIDQRVDRLPAHERGALWLQTPEGEVWPYAFEQSAERLDWNSEAIREFQRDRIVEMAGRSSNARIRAYLALG